MAIGASTASAATLTKYNVTGTAVNPFIYSGNHGTVKCAKLTFTGQVTQPAVATEPKTGSVTSLTSSNCINTYANLPMTVTLKTPWTVSITNNIAKVTGFNIHEALTGAPEQVNFDLTAGTLTFPVTPWVFTKNVPLTVTNVTGGALAFGLAQAGPGYMEAGFAVTYTKVS
jgi:hypothetical protein